MHQGKAIIFSAPSGAGKTTIVRHLLKVCDRLGFSISASTRPRRENHEESGKDYFFLTPEEFKDKIRNDEFVEWEEVYAGTFYGTLKSEVRRVWDEGKQVVFDVDVKGGLKLKKYFGDAALAVFVKAPSPEVLKTRLINRQTESADRVAQRMAKADYETTFENQFDVTLVNADLRKSLQQAENLVHDFLR